MARVRGRFLLFILPISAVAVVLLGVVSGGVRPFRSARVYSGPTEGITDLALRVELGDRDRVVEVPAADVPFEVAAMEAGRRVAGARGRTDSSGSAEVSVRLPRARESALELWVAPLGHDLPPLARGLVQGSRRALEAAPRRGGFQSGRHSGEILLAVAPARGVLVTAQGALDDELVVRASQNGAALGGARIHAKLEGAEPAESDLRTDVGGLARLRLRPSDAHVRVALDTAVEGVGAGTLATRLDVVQGAIRASLQGERLLLESSGAASTAYLGFFDERQRYCGAHTELTQAPDGRLVGELPWPQLATASPLWVVVSSQPDLASPSAVGWPIRGVSEPDPKTLDARELLLLDGAPQARAREDRRARRIRWVTAAYASLALLGTLWLFVQRVKDADRNIEQHLSRAGVDDAALSIAPVRKGRAVIAAACIGLGFVVLVVFALLKD